MATELLGSDLEKFLPPVRRMVHDPQVRLYERCIDEEWAYNRHCKSVRGWNPFSGCIYYGARSATSDWLSHPERSLRSLNEGDLFLPEILFAFHDYLHVWSTRMIQHLEPGRGFGHGPITSPNLEALTFLLLVTEAVATVGLDYWYLSTFRLNDTLPVGTALTNLAVSYREEELAEYRRAHPTLEVQHPSFFAWICRLYSTGVAEGLSKGSLKQSPVTLNWIGKELRYGRTQRKYARSWLQHLSGERLYGSTAELTAPVDCSEPWQESVIEEIGNALWRMIKQDDAVPTPAAAETASWAAPEGRPFDPRYDNLSALTDPQRDLAARGIVPGTFDELFAQTVSSLDFAACSASVRPCLDSLRASRSPQLLLEFLKHYPKVEQGNAGPKDLFFSA